MNISKNDLKRFNNTVGADICFNDSYNLAKGYCKYEIFKKLSSIKKLHFGVFPTTKKLTEKILKLYPQEITLI
jgi:hypothetical protein